MDLISKTEIVRGTLEPGDIAVPLGVTEMEVSIDQTEMKTPGVACRVGSFLSLDGGLTWRPWGGFGCVSGERLDVETGKLATKSCMIIKVPEPKNPNRKIRTTITLTGNATTALRCEMK